MSGVSSFLASIHSCLTDWTGVQSSSSDATCGTNQKVALLAATVFTGFVLKKFNDKRNAIIKLRGQIENSNGSDHPVKSKESVKEELVGICDKLSELERNVIELLNNLQQGVLDNGNFSPEEIFTPLMHALFEVKQEMSRKEQIAKNSRFLVHKKTFKKINEINVLIDEINARISDHIQLIITKECRRFILFLRGRHGDLQIGMESLEKTLWRVGAGDQHKYLGALLHDKIALVQKQQICQTLYDSALAHVKKMNQPLLHRLKEAIIPEDKLPKKGEAIEQDHLLAILYSLLVEGDHSGNCFIIPTNWQQNEFQCPDDLPKDGIPHFVVIPISAEGCYHTVLIIDHNRQNYVYFDSAGDSDVPEELLRGLIDKGILPCSYTKNAYSSTRQTDGKSSGYHVIENTWNYTRYKQPKISQPEGEDLRAKYKEDFQEFVMTHCAVI